MRENQPTKLTAVSSADRAINFRAAHGIHHKSPALRAAEYLPCARITLVARPLGVVEHLKSFLELRRDRDAELFAGRQPPDKPFVVERNQIAVRAELAEGALDHRGELRLAL